MKWGSRKKRYGARWVWAALTCGAAFSWVGMAHASPSYGQTMARTYVSEAEISADTACLYCHPNVQGMVVTETFGLAMKDDRGLTGNSNRALFVSLMDELMLQLDSYQGDPLQANDLLDSDGDDVPDALEIRWGSSPSDPTSYLVADEKAPGRYRTVGTYQFPPVRYGCGAQLAPGSLHGGTAATITLLLSCLGWRRRRAHG